MCDFDRVNQLDWDHPLHYKRIVFEAICKKHRQSKQRKTLPDFIEKVLDCYFDKHKGQYPTRKKLYNDLLSNDHELFKVLFESKHTMKVPDNSSYVFFLAKQCIKDNSLIKDHVMKWKNEDFFIEESQLPDTLESDQDDQEEDNDEEEEDDELKLIQTIMPPPNHKQQCKRKFKELSSAMERENKDLRKRIKILETNQRIILQYLERIGCEIK